MRGRAVKGDDRPTVTDGETFERFLPSRAYKMSALGTNLPGGRLPSRKAALQETRRQLDGS